MEKLIRVGWSDLLKVVLIVGAIATAWGVQQAKISDLEKGREQNRHNIELLNERMRMQEIQIATVNEKLNLIYNDVTVIKDCLLGVHNPGK